MQNQSINLTIIDRDGNEHQIEAPLGLNLNVMEICRAADLPMEGTCGGMALCASCHVYVLSDHNLPGYSEDEEEMLDQAFFVEENSRLCCQLPINESLNGLKIKLAPVDD